MATQQQHERKELSKIDAFREHCAALKRHIDNTGSYLRKEVRVVEGKIAESKGLMEKSVGISIEDADAVDEYLEEKEREQRVKAMVRQEIEEEGEEEFDSNPPRYLQKSTNSLRSSKQSLEYKPRTTTL